MHTRAYPFVVALFMSMVLSGPAWSLTIVSPRPGEQVIPGQSIWLIVQPDIGAETEMRSIQVLAPGASGCENINPLLPIQCMLTIPDGAGKRPLPVAIDIRVLAVFANGSESRASTHVVVGDGATEQSP